jgi:hypothetical protein
VEIQEIDKIGGQLLRKIRENYGGDFLAWCNVTKPAPGGCADSRFVGISRKNIATSISDESGGGQLTARFPHKLIKEPRAEQPHSGSGMLGCVYLRQRRIRTPIRRPVAPPR